MLMRMVKVLVVVVVALGLVAFAAGQAGLLAGTPPGDLGVRDGRLKRPSPTPNSVSSQAALWPADPAAQAAIEPLPLAGTPDETMATIERLVRATPGAVVVKVERGYLHATFTTQWMKFTDDAEFWFDPAAQVVQVRSASRLGRRDMGTNRARIEALRAQMAAAVR